MHSEIGLQRGIVVLTDYQPIWSDAFEREKSALQKAAGDFVSDIQHIGSTAVPGLAAKPIIDLAAAVSSLSDVASFQPALEIAGYHYRENGSDESQTLFVKGPENRRTHHLHIVVAGSRVWNDYLAFRDYLRAHPEEAERYEQLKRALATKFANDRPSYTAGKREFIEAVLRQSP